MDFGVIFAWSMLLAIVGFFVFLIREIQKQKQHQIKLKALFQERKKHGNLPTKYLPVSKFRESISDAMLDDCEILYLAILDEAEQGKITFSTSDLARWMNSYRVLASMSLFWKKHPVLFIVILLISFPISWIFIVLAVVAMVFHSTQAGKMESAFSRYLSGSAKVGTNPTPQSQSSSLAVEIQKLEDMRTKGVISDEEFSQLKKKLISA